MLPSLSSSVDRWDLALTEIRGANYLPAKAFNAYQMWRAYDPVVIERDLNYAARLNLNAVRVFLSFEYWREDPSTLETAFEHLLDTAVARKMRVLPALFDTIGAAPTEGNLTDHNPLTATGVFSPSAAIVENRQRWDQPQTFVRWIMDRYRDDSRVLALDVMNEPGVHGLPAGKQRLSLARALMQTMTDHRGKVPLTVGTLYLENTRFFADLGLDVLQFHWNFPPSTDAMRTRIEQAVSSKRIQNTPVWLSEWQRVRLSGSGWTDQSIAAEETVPNYSSLAELVRASQVNGDFFWSLMLKPAYTLLQRQQGTLTGVFHEDGAVWRREDAQALAGTSVRVPERRTWPQWAKVVPQQYGVNSASDWSETSSRNNRNEERTSVQTKSKRPLLTRTRGRQRR